MKITSSKRDDILKERDAYNKLREETESKRREEGSAFFAAQREILDPIEKEIIANLSRFNLIEFNVFADMWYGDRGIVVHVKADDRKLHDDTSALSWSFDVYLNNATGEVVKDTGSWSGLRATTFEQLASLQQTRDALMYLNYVDWKKLLDKVLPDYQDYFKTQGLPDRSAEFNKRLIEDQLESLVGTNKLVRVRNFESSGYNGRSIFVRLIRETPAQYVCNVISDWELSKIRSGQYKLEDRFTQRVKKSNIVPIRKDNSSDELDIVEL